MKKRKKWTKFRHKVVTALLHPFFRVVAALRYHADVERFRGQGKRNWLILANHQTSFDQFFIGAAFRKPVYYVAMEDLFSNGWVSKLITWLVAPIPIVKARTDVRAALNCIKIAGEGGNIALFPEGNRTYSGRTCHINPAVAQMAIKLGLPIAIFRIEGGYGVKPRWSDKIRRGKMKAGVRRVIEPEEYNAMSKEELYELICKELFVDEAKPDGQFYSRRAAEHLERVVYLCPDCGLSEFESKKDLLTCMRCDRQYRYRPDKQLEALQGDSRFRYVADWYDYQESYVRSMDLSPYVSEPLYSESADLLEVIVYRRKQLLRKNAPIVLYADRLEIGSGTAPLVLAYEDIRAMACIAGHKLNVFYRDKIYQFRGGKSFNALKYCNIYYHAKYSKEEHTDGEFQFLGL